MPWGQVTRKTLVKGGVTGVREHVGATSMLGRSGRGGRVTRTQRAAASVLLGRGRVRSCGRRGEQPSLT